MRQDGGRDGAGTGEALDRAVYDGLAAVLGSGPVGGMAQRFRADLQRRFAEVSARDALRRDAHAVVAAAGMLGFEQLSQAARVLERACAADADLASPLAALLSARAAADRCLQNLARGEA